MQRKRERTVYDDLFDAENGIDITSTSFGFFDFDNEYVEAQKSTAREVVATVVNTQEKRDTELHDAVIEQDLRKIRELLNFHRELLEVPSSTGKTPLSLAVLINFHRGIELLLIYGANMNLQTADDSPYELAQRCGDARTREILEAVNPRKMMKNSNN